MNRRTDADRNADATRTVGGTANRTRGDRNAGRTDRSATEDVPTRLQRQLGNRAVQRFVADAARGRTVGDRERTDRLEREAERVARKVATGDAKSGTENVTPPRSAKVRESADGGDGPQRRRNESPAPDGETGTVRPASGSGRPLPDPVRSFFEARMGWDFAGVRIHTDGQADAAARAVDARAFTTGHDVVFRTGEYRPDTWDGTRLLAHELTHVVQQTGGRAADVPGSISRVSETIQRQETPTPEETPEEIEPGISLEGECVQTTGSGTARRSASSFDARYAWESNENEEIDHAEIYLHKRGSKDEIRSKTVEANRGMVTFAAGIPVNDENARYQLRLKLVRTNGSERFAAGLVPVRFQVCELESKPSGVHLKFAQMLYAEGADAGEFPWVRDIVYNRIDWVKQCKADVSSFGQPNINAVLTHPNQFESVLSKTPKFKELEEELDQHSGECEYTTSPRSAAPDRCRLVNAAITAEANGNGNTHDYVFFRSDTNTPSKRAVNRGHYPGGNYYWEISGCPGNGGSGSPDARSGSADGSTDGGTAGSGDGSE